MVLLWEFISDLTGMGLRPLDSPLRGITGTALEPALDSTAEAFLGATLVGLADFVSAQVVFTGLPTKPSAVFLFGIKIMKITITY